MNSSRIMLNLKYGMFKLKMMLELLTLKSLTLPKLAATQLSIYKNYIEIALRKMLLLLLSFFSHHIHIVTSQTDSYNNHLNHNHSKYL